MSRNNGALVQYKEPSSGTQHRHNFVNRYLADDDLRKPSQEVAQAVYNATKQELNRIVGTKTDTAHVSVIILIFSIFLFSHPGPYLTSF